jgi:hypothetical protein
MSVRPGCEVRMSENFSHNVHNDCLWYLLSVVPIVTSEVLVLLPTESSKMTATWKGPFRIVRKLSDVNNQVNVGARRGLVTYHINLLKRYNRI